MEPRLLYGFKQTAPLKKRTNYFSLVAHGAVRFRWHSYGAVRRSFKQSGILRCGSVWFSDFVSPTVRFGAVIYPTVRFGAVFRIRECYSAVWCGF